MADREPISLDHLSLVSDRLRRYPPEISEHTFVNLFAWRHHRPVLLGKSQGCLVFLSEQDGRRALLGPPLGEASPAELLEELARADVSRAERLPAPAAEALEAEGFEPESDRDNADYVYRREDLAELAGNRYHRQRNLVNQCLAAHDCSWCEITPDILEEVAELQERWCDERNCRERRGLCAEYRAIRQTLLHYKELDLMGGAVRIEGRLEAYTIGGRLNPQTAVVHFEKAMSRFNGLYQVVNQWFCRESLGAFEFVNREQDLGIPGLRKAKESYHPHHMVEKFTVSLTHRPSESRRSAAGGRCRG